MTDTAPSLSSGPDQRAISEHLARILKSPPFLNSHRKRRFLEFIVGETMAGRGDRIKGYAIALQVFDRPANFDPIADPIVRVEAARLRDALDQYYSREGPNDAIRIALPKGTYVPQFLVRTTTPSPGAFGHTKDAYPSHNRSAHEELLRGLEKFWRYSREDCAQAEEYFAQAVELDPRYASAHAWLARAYVFQRSMGWAADFTETMNLAIVHARHAVELEPESSFVHSVLGWVLLFTRDGENAVAECRRACALDSNSADAKLFLSLNLASACQGEEALHTIETAILMQPHPSSFHYFALGMAHFALADYDRAITAFSRGIEINPAFMPNHYELAVTYGVCGRVEEARAEAAIVTADWPNASKDFFYHPPLESIWLHGKRVAGLD